MEVFLSEFYDVNKKSLITVGIFSAFVAAKDSHSSWLSEYCLITKIKIDSIVCKNINNKCIDNLGRLDHWHYDPETKEWI